MGAQRVESDWELLVHSNLAPPPKVLIVGEGGGKVQTLSIFLTF